MTGRPAGLSIPSVRPGSGSGSWRARRLAFALLLPAAALSACSQPLPEEGSPAASLYASRCGGCHVVYQPKSMTMAMWKLQIDRMDQKYRAAGIAVPSADEKTQILDYLNRHAGG